MLIFELQYVRIVKLGVGMSSAFQMLLRVRYGECDAQQVVFNPRYADYVDVAVTEYYRALFGGYQYFLDRGLDCQVVNLQIQWKSSARFDDVLSLSIEQKHLGSTSYSLSVQIKHQSENRLVADAEIVYVMVDAKTFEKVSIPDDIRQKLDCDALGCVVNQAGV